MKKSKCWSRVVCMLLVASMIVAVAGCGLTQSKDASGDQAVTIEPMEAETPYTYTFDAIGGQDVMPIVGYYGAKPVDYSYNGNDLINPYSDEYFELLFDGTGINMISSNHTYADTVPYLLDELMKLAEKHGVGVLVHDKRISGDGQGLTDLTVEMVDQYISEYSSYPAYCGNYIVDEPGYVAFDPVYGDMRALEGYYPAFQALDQLDIYGYANLWPLSAGKYEMYPEYIQQFIQNCKPKVVSYDYYPFETQRGLSRAGRFIENMSIIRSEGEKAGIPFWVFLQAGANWEKGTVDTEEYFPNKAEVTWSASVALAMGAKGIQYFPIVQPNRFSYALSEPFDTQRNGLISLFGNKTRWYYYAADINAHIKEVDEVLMNSVNKGILISGKETEKAVLTSNTQYLMEGKSWRELADFNGEAMVGCFNYQGKTALYVASFDLEYAQKIQLDFVKKCDVTVIQNTETQHLSGKGIELVLEPGNGALIVFE